MLSPPVRGDALFDVFFVDVFFVDVFVFDAFVFDGFFVDVFLFTAIAFAYNSRDQSGCSFHRAKNTAAGTCFFFRHRNWY